MLPSRAYFQTAFSVLVSFLMCHLLPRRGPFPSTAFAHAAHQLQFLFLLLLGPPMSPPITHRPRHQRQRYGHSPVHRRVSDPASLTAHSRNGTVRAALHPLARFIVHGALTPPPATNCRRTWPSFQTSHISTSATIVSRLLPPNSCALPALPYSCTAQLLTAVQIRVHAARRLAHGCQQCFCDSRCSHASERCRCRAFFFSAT